MNQFFVTSGFSCLEYKNCELVRYSMACSEIALPKFRDNLSVEVKKIKCFCLRNGTYKLSRNIGNITSSTLCEVHQKSEVLIRNQQ
jgi:hypothetical protein